MEPGDSAIQSYGYLDLVTFAMGPEIIPATFRDVRFLSGNPIINADEIGMVEYIKCVNWREEGPVNSFSILLKLTLEFTGLDVDALVKTLGGRFYGQVPDRIFGRLSEGNRMSQFRDKLGNLYHSYPEDPDDISSWIADAIGLSNTALESPVGSVLTPMRFLQTHGDTLHLGNAGAVVGVNCPSCYKNFLLRVALLEPESDVLGAKAYRIPGLRYEFTHPEGAGFLLKHRRIVGRFIWGTLTCECHRLEDIEIQLDGFPSPRPNKYEYGRQTNEEWHPLRLEDRIRT